MVGQRLWVGLQPGERAGVYQSRAPETVITLLAVLKTGAAYVPLDPGYPAERLRFFVRDQATEVPGVVNASLQFDSAALAPTFEVLLGARLVQGAGAALPGSDDRIAYEVGDEVVVARFTGPAGGAVEQVVKRCEKLWLRRSETQIDDPAALIDRVFETGEERLTVTKSAAAAVSASWSGSATALKWS